MRTIGATKFKEQCLALLDNLGPEGLVVTKHVNWSALLRIRDDYRCGT